MKKMKKLKVVVVNPLTNEQKKLLIEELKKAIEGK